MVDRSRANSEGSLFAYRNGYAAYVGVTTPVGTRAKKWIYGQDRAELHGRGIDLQKQARGGPVATEVPKARTFLGSVRSDDNAVRRVRADPGTGPAQGRSPRPHLG
jgi:hypothetical protein